MKFNPSPLRELEKRDLHLWILLMTVFLISTVFIIYLIFYSDLTEFFQEKEGVFSFDVLFIGYSGLSLFLIAYIILREMAIRRLRRNLLEEKINLSAALEKHYEKLKALFAVSAMVNSEVELPKIFEMVPRVALDCLGGDQSSLMIYDHRKGKLRCVSAHGREIEKVKDASVYEGKSVCGWVLKQGKPLLLTPELLENYSFSNLIKKERTINSALCVPLRVKGKVKGVLNVNSLSKDKKFSHEDLNLLSIFADNVAVSIERAGLYRKYENFKKLDSRPDQVEIAGTGGTVTESKT